MAASSFRNLVAGSGTVSMTSGSRVLTFSQSQSLKEGATISCANGQLFTIDVGSGTSWTAMQAATVTASGQSFDTTDPSTSRARGSGVIVPNALQNLYYADRDAAGNPDWFFYVDPVFPENGVHPYTKDWYAGPPWVSSRTVQALIPDLPTRVRVLEGALRGATGTLSSADSRLSSLESKLVPVGCVMPYAGYVASGVVQDISDAYENLKTASRTKASQGFQLPLADTVPTVKAWVKRAGSYPGKVVWVTIQTDSAGSPSGTVLATSNSISYDSLLTTAGYVDFTFPTPPSLSAGVLYHVVMDTDYVYDGAQGTVQWSGATVTQYPGGTAKSWTTSWEAAGVADFRFKVVVSTSVTAPAGWLLCDGSAVSRTTYAGLFAVIGTWYGVGDGSTTFNLPDLRGRVVAGKDDMGGNAAGRLMNPPLFGATLGASGVSAPTGTASSVPTLVLNYIIKATLSLDGGQGPYTYAQLLAQGDQA